MLEAAEANLCKDIQLLDNVMQGGVQSHWPTGENFQWVCLRFLLLFLFSPSPSSSSSTRPRLAPCCRAAPTGTAILTQGLGAGAGNAAMPRQAVDVLVAVGDSLCWWLFTLITEMLETKEGEKEAFSVYRFCICFGVQERVFSLTEVPVLTTTMNTVSIILIKCIVSHKTLAHNQTAIVMNRECD